MDASLIYTKPQSRPDKMKTLDTCRPRIDYKHIAFGITYNLKDMGVPAYKYIRPGTVYKFTGLEVISSRIATYMGHKHLQALTFKKPMNRVSIAKIIIVTIACNPDKRLEGCYFLSQLHAAAEVPRMPDLIDLREEFLELLGEDPVCI